MSFKPSKCLSILLLSQPGLYDEVRYKWASLEPSLHISLAPALQAFLAFRE